MATTKKKAGTVNGITVIDGVPLVKLASIKPFKLNPRTHPEEQIRALTAWIMEVGFIVPVLLDKNHGLIEGHGRVAAAKALGMDRIPALSANHLTEKQVRAHVIAGNKLAAMATWDPLNLNAMLEEVKVDYDLRAIGFSDVDLKRLGDDVDRLLMQRDSQPDPDERAVSRGEEPAHDDEEGESGGEERLPERGPDETVPFSVLLTQDERTEVYAAIRKVKDRDGISMSSVAMLTIIREWNR
jgi:ParB-like chromosome segregation protein Spo0J